ncbi:MAG: protoporphyrinogen oxidase [Actinomycetales bacterium]|nr:protoporphyrinogen oxidase [Actinomycetales bacterium]
MRSPQSVAVVGGGISGLATAYFLTHPEDGSRGVPEVTLLEAGPALGGKIATVDVAGFPVDTGPDAVLARVPLVGKLFADLGLAGAMQGPASRRAYVWTRGVLRPLPPGSVFGVPEHLLPLLRSGLLGPWGVARAGADLVMPRLRIPADPSIEQLLRPRFGRQVYDRLIEPMLGGVHAGRADALSARSAVPEVFALAQRHRSTYLGLRRRGPRNGSGPALVAVEGGLTRLVDTLRDALTGVEVRTGVTATGVERDGRRYSVHADGRDPLEVDRVVLATPARASAALLRGVCPEAAEVLAAVPYVGVATVTLAYPRSAVDRELDGTGFLVPPVERRFLVGCSWLTAKWPYLDDPDTALFRCMVGRYGDESWAELDDDELVLRVHTELAEALGVTGQPTHVHVQRWPGAMPQYTIGHETRLQVLDTALRAVPGIHLTGAAYRGVGIAGCITQANATARRVLDGVSPPPTRVIDVSGGATAKASRKRRSR